MLDVDVMLDVEVALMLLVRVGDDVNDILCVGDVVGRTAASQHAYGAR